MTIIRSNGYSDIDVQFEDGMVSLNRQYIDFEKGNIKNYNYPSIYNKGYFGIGNYNLASDRKVYTVWLHMLKRCYDHNDHRYEFYKDCEVYENWLNFQNFAHWYNENLYTIETEDMEIDKDIIDKKSRLYSPTTCCIVPNKINSLFIKEKNQRGDFPIGVCYHKSTNSFVALCCFNGKQKHLGCFDNPNNAFNAYKIAKENEIKRVANLYKEKIPEFIYNALMRYEVDIDD